MLSAGIVNEREREDSKIMPRSLNGFKVQDCFMNFVSQDVFLSPLK